MKKLYRLTAMHPNGNVLTDFALGHETPGIQRWREHVEECDDCQAKLNRLWHLCEMRQAINNDLWPEVAERRYREFGYDADNPSHCGMLLFPRPWDHS